MRKGMIGAVAALFIVGAPVAHAQQATTGPGATPESERLSQTEFKMLTDIRVGVIKAALQLTPEQEKLWPAVEEAIRARARRATADWPRWVSAWTSNATSIQCSFTASAPMSWRTVRRA